MRLRLVSPVKRPGSANAQFVKRIPLDLKDSLAGRELLVPLDERGASVFVKIGAGSQSVRFSLRASQPLEIKKRQAFAATYLEEVFAALRENRPLSLSRSQVTALAGELYRSWAAEQNRGIAHIEQGGRMVRVDAFDILDDQAEMEGLMLTAEKITAATDDALGPKLESAVGALADKLLGRKGIMRLDADSRHTFLSVLPRALVEGMQARAKTLGGDFRPDEAASRFPIWEALPKEAPKGLPASTLSLTGLVEAWWTEAQAAGKSESTRESYTNSFRILSTFLSHDDALRVTPEDIINFKDHRLKTPNPKTGKPVSAKTVKASDLTAFKSVFDWAVSNRKLSANPATGVTVKLGKKVKVRERDFNKEETTAILSAASAVGSNGRLSETNAMKRWVPWLCAYTGSRVGEMVQLRKEDIRDEDGHWIITITPEAGTVKGKERRDVPIHAHLVELGFVEFVRTSKDGYLFMTIKPRKSFRGTWQSKKNRLAEFVRTVVKDPNVAPNHGWRHTFKTRGIEAGIQEKVLDAICGHAPGTVGRAYGSVSMQTKIDAMADFPRCTL